MPTDYPDSVDDFTNPTSDDTMDGGEVGGDVVQHDIQHSNVNDAVEAVQTTLGTTGAFNFSDVARLPPAPGAQPFSPKAVRGISERERSQQRSSSFAQGYTNSSGTVSAEAYRVARSLRGMRPVAEERSPPP